MSMLELEAPIYQPPDNGWEVNERPILGTDLRVILYVGEVATLDIVKSDESHESTTLVESLSAPRELATDLFNHPSGYLSNSRARELFDPGKALTGYEQAA